MVEFPGMCPVIVWEAPFCEEVKIVVMWRYIIVYHQRLPLRTEADRWASQFVTGPNGSVSSIIEFAPF